jgi:hypothetical protein
MSLDFTRFFLKPCGWWIINARRESFIDCNSENFVTIKYVVNTTWIHHVGSIQISEWSEKIRYEHSYWVFGVECDNCAIKYIQDTQYEE